MDYTIVEEMMNYDIIDFNEETTLGLLELIYALELKVVTILETAEIWRPLEIIINSEKDIHLQIEKT